MPKISPTDLGRELQQGRIQPLYLLVGEEYFLVQDALGLIKEAVVGKHGDESAVLSLSAREADAGRVIGALRTVPLLGGRPMVIISDGGQLARDQELLEALTAYAEAPVAQATLVIAAEKLDGRLKFSQQVAKSGTVVECKKLYDDKVPGWAGMQVKRRGRQISQEAAKFLAEMVGNDLGQIVQAIDRVILFIGERPTIELADVEQVVTDTHQRDVFALTDAVGQRNTARALSYLQNLLANGQAPPLIVHMLARHFRILAKAREIAGRTADRGEIARYIGVNPYFLDNYLSQARNFSRAELRASFAVLHRCDRESKSSRMPKERVLERAILKLTAQKGVAP